MEEEEEEEDDDDFMNFGEKELEHAVEDENEDEVGNDRIVFDWRG